MFKQAAMLAMCAVSTVALAQDPYANAPAYAKAVPGSGVSKIQPLITTGQQIPLTGGSPSDKYLFVGIPDGIGAYVTKSGDDRKSFTLTVNHELRPTQGTPFGSLPGGARVSKLKLRVRGEHNPQVTVKSGELAFDKVFGPLPGGGYGEIPTPPSGFGRFCSATLGFRDVGLDRPIHFTGEENGPPADFSGDGSVATAIFDGAVHILPDIGKADFENVVPAPFTGKKTVLLITEDAGTFDSQLYMYVGTKDPKSSDPLKKNGLIGGSFYVFVSDHSTFQSEATFTTKGQSLLGHWEKVDSNARNTAADLQAEVAAKGAFGFVRVEDLTADHWHPGVAYFVTTGSPNTPNPFGHLYKLQFNPSNPTGTTRLTILLDGSEGFVSPDNIDVNRHGEIVFLEDPNYNLATDLHLTRDTSAWLYDTKTRKLTRIFEMDRDAARAHALAADPLNTSAASSDTPGGWEFSGVIDAERFLGRGAWIIDAQAHSLRINPTTATVEGGQIFYVKTTSKDHDCDRDYK